MQIISQVSCARKHWLWPVRLGSSKQQHLSCFMQAAVLFPAAPQICHAAFATESVHRGYRSVSAPSFPRPPCRKQPGHFGECVHTTGDSWQRWLNQAHLWVVRVWPLICQGEVTSIYTKEVWGMWQRIVPWGGVTPLLLLSPVVHGSGGKCLPYNIIHCILTIVPKISSFPEVPLMLFRPFKSSFSG